MKLSKMLGVAIVAALALSVVASASAAQFKGSTSPVTVSGAQSTTHKFTVEGSAVTCTTATFSSAPTAVPTSEVLITPVYKGCTAFGIAGATVSMNGCQYKFHSGPPGTVDLICSSGKTVIAVSTFLGKCKVEIPGSNASKNQGLGGVTYTNTPAGKVTVGANVTTITAEVVESTGICPLTKGTVNNASYSGDTIVEGNGGAATIEVS
jgi:hypothetical protein